jgi:hypothetical protein
MLYQQIDRYATEAWASSVMGYPTTDVLACMNNACPSMCPGIREGVPHLRNGRSVTTTPSARPLTTQFLGQNHRVNHTECGMMTATRVPGRSSSGQGID